MALLEIDDMSTGYNGVPVVRNLNLHVNEGEVVTLLGRNGAGRTTTLRAIMGLTGRRTGSIRIKPKP